MNIAEITPDNPLLTLINTFTVDPANQSKLIDLLTAATEGSITKVPGFIACTLHKGLDGTKVTMYSQWESLEDYQNMRRNPAASPYLDQALQLARFESGMYEVVREFIKMG